MPSKALYVYQHREVLPADFCYNVAAQVVMEQLSNVICDENTSYLLNDAARLVSSHVEKYVVYNIDEVKGVVELMVLNVLREALTKLPLTEYRLIGVKKTKSKLVFKLEERP